MTSYIADHSEDPSPSVHSNENPVVSKQDFQDGLSPNFTTSDTKDSPLGHCSNHPSPSSNVVSPGESHANAFEPSLDSSYVQGPSPAEAYPSYYFYGYYPSDPSLGYPHPFSANDYTSYTREEGPWSAESIEEPARTGMYPSPTAMVTPVPVGVYYSMPVYQRQVCYTGPSGVPMVGIPMAHAFPGTTSSSGPNTEHPYGGQSPTPSYRSGPYPSSGPSLLNPSSQAFHPTMPTNREGLGHYVYHDPRYFPYTPGGMHPMAPLMHPPVPLPSGYPVPPYEWTSYPDRAIHVPSRRASAPHRRRKSTAHPSHCSSTSSLATTSGDPDSRDTATDVNHIISSQEAIPETKEALSPSLTTKSSSQALSGAASANQLHGTRSDYVMWCGNVPSDATLDELWSFFGKLSLSSSETHTSESPESSHGILSIFIISRSSCAFVNYKSQEHLDRACTYFQGKTIRAKPNCPRLVCRPRKLEDAEYAGVAAQRGKGVHTSWYRQQCKLIQEANIQASQDGIDAGDDSDANSTHSFTSTNSSLLRQPLFAHRFFILKSRTREALETALETHVWCTQPHNEPVLDQAFRNSEVVTLFFSENFSGQFFGFANMASSPGKTQTSLDPPQTTLASQSMNDTYGAAAISSSDEQTEKAEALETNCASPTLSICSSVSATPSGIAEQQIRRDLVASAKHHNQSLEDMGDQTASLSTNKDFIAPMRENDEAPIPQSETFIHESRTLQVGQPFNLEWKITKPLPFSEIHNLRNPWRDNRLIKVSRDGTELEPNIGRQLMAIWEAYLSQDN